MVRPASMKQFLCLSLVLWILLVPARSEARDVLVYPRNDKPIASQSVVMTARYLDSKQAQPEIISYSSFGRMDPDVIEDPQTKTAFFSNAVFRGLREDQKRTAVIIKDAVNGKYRVSCVVEELFGNFRPVKEMDVEIKGETTSVAVEVPQVFDVLFEIELQGLSVDMNQNGGGEFCILASPEESGGRVMMWGLSGLGGRGRESGGLVKALAITSGAMKGYLVQMGRPPDKRQFWPVKIPYVGDEESGQISKERIGVLDTEALSLKEVSQWVRDWVEKE